jgi:hypothetical protein
MIPTILQFFAHYKLEESFDAFFIRTKIQYFPLELKDGDYIDVEKTLLPIIDVEESGGDKNLILHIFEEKDDYIRVHKDREWINVKNEWVLLIELTFEINE